mmetsp:Transcript_10494/g.17760  ORF Transcript_10494/g.17760 Transcript_10494/m.17760 type:complete len:278 (+) Transcript_10494:616-1449(+)
MQVLGDGDELGHELCAVADKRLRDDGGRNPGADVVVEVDEIEHVGGEVLEFVLVPSVPEKLTRADLPKDVRGHEGELASEFKVIKHVPRQFSGTDVLGKDWPGWLLFARCLGDFGLFDAIGDTGGDDAKLFVVGDETDKLADVDLDSLREDVVLDPVFEEDADAVLDGLRLLDVAGLGHVEALDEFGEELEVSGEGVEHDHKDVDKVAVVLVRGSETLDEFVESGRLDVPQRGLRSFEVRDVVRVVLWFVPQTHPGVFIIRLFLRGGIGSQCDEPQT